MKKQQFIGLGVAGNFAGHLEQAGEAADFVKVKTQNAIQPKAIFPFYIPSNKLSQSEQFLSTYPLSNDKLSFPHLEDADNLQIEPEVALICELVYRNNKVVEIKPSHFAAYNDCSIRRPNARKICEKKNWGINSKGISKNWIKIDRFERGGNLDHYHIACFHQRNGKLTEYGVDSPTVGYSYFHQQLLTWIIDRMNNQPDEDPMNNIANLLKQADYPTQAIISIGATRYTEFGETHFLQPQDTSIVVLYDHNRHTHDDVVKMINEQQFPEDVSALIQTVV
ncbi:DUF5718 family protein [Pasteurella atlantica]|uniref:DUF5718 family protein n=1 Tax=Pasteurellaceae TaxID=712 RepID=UPI00275EFA16|nr:DUF5718 family protein [Pasteurella atlantica]MDP8032763.1 DUF5718 family protein [Pasteurella atlantica]MDP8034731.1 DUF5718 family protein [Pasteurella atlantica]MDP8036681.1 DUF5718 family protein [Pasteurella atlantica]MDP8046997.1 DUF5718 family protein [Pasteurella atlantica]MDP8048950.1 DUF5718 family protein [Pasteurella atlantica]